MSDRKRAVKALDTAFSKWVRLSGADHAGFCECWTCGIRKHYTRMDAGHFQTRAKYSTRWDERNVKPQCKRCNMTNGGHQYEFAKRLDAEYGRNTAEQVTFDSNQPRKYTTQEIRDLTALYRRKVRDLES